MKKKYFLLVIIFIMLSSTAYSQWIWLSQNSGTNNALYSIAFADLNTGWSVGNSGIILKTTNSGGVWTSQISGTSNYLNSVFPINNNLVWAVGAAGTVLKSTNGGSNWTSSTIGSTLVDVCFANITTGWIVGGVYDNNGLILKTSNGGINWNSQTIPGKMLWCVYFTDNSTGWVGGQNGTLLKTTDQGITWINQNIQTTGILGSIQFINPNTGWANANGTIFKTTNGGYNWIDLQRQFVRESFFIDDETGWAVGEGFISKTTNGGTNWTNESCQLNILPTALHFVGNSGWVTGSEGKILHNNGFEAGNDVGVTSIIIPKQDTILYTGCITGTVNTPSVIIKNFGVNNQTVPFNVKFSIIYDSDTIYADSKQDTISSHESHLIEFEPFVTPPDTGYYKVFVRTILPGDTIYYNDSATSRCKILSAHYGIEPYRGDAGQIRYKFSNSTIEASCASISQPIFHWEDTTGSVNLISNGIPTIPLSFGNIDDGYFYLPGFLTDFNFYYGSTFDLRVYTDGYLRLIGYGGYAGGDISGFQGDLNFADNDVIGKNLKYKITENKIVFTYDRVPAKNNNFDPEDYLTFQIILNTSGSDKDVIVLQYNKSMTGNSFLQKYMNNEIIPHKVGIYFSVHAGLEWGIDYRYKIYDGRLYNIGPIFENDSIAVAFGQNEDVLPIELQSFTSSVSENDVSLSWVVNSQTNNSGFEIERSIIHVSNSPGWIKVGYVSGNGTSTIVQQFSFDDKKLSTGKYKYRLKQIDFNGSFNYYELQNEVEIGVPGKFELSQNYPNPFNPKTTIDFNIPSDMKVTLKIFDVSGREIISPVNEFKTAGYYSINFDGSNLSSGIYFYTLKAGSFSITKKFVILK